MKCLPTMNDDIPDATGPSASGTVPIDIHFLRSYPSLQSKSDDQLARMVAKLQEEWIETDADLHHVSRDSLSSKLPAMALDALKPQKRGREDKLVKKMSRLKTERDMFRLAALRVRSMTERVLSVSDDLLDNMFQNAPIEAFWLPPHRSPYEIVDTHNTWKKLTQDATLFLRGRSQVELTIAAIIELVGQDEREFPSKNHTAKLLRNCMRIYRRCGSNREVHGVITDLSRIVAVKMTGVDDEHLPRVVKTAVLEGVQVEKVLTQFALAMPHLLGVQGKRILFPGDIDGTLSRPTPLLLECEKALGRGLHGTVYTVVGPGRENHYIKYFSDQQKCQKEADMLQLLVDKSIPNVPTLAKVSHDGHSMLGSPVGKDVVYWQGHGILWKFGLFLLDTLEQLHAKQLCHRDVQPNNIIVLGNETPVLIDWVSMAAIGEKVDDEYVGTTHYACMEVLDSLMDGNVPTPLANHDLESLVYTIYSLSREPTTDYPQAIEIENDRPPADFYGAVKAAWQQAAQTNEMVRVLVEAAQNCDYHTLKTEFGKKF